MSLYSIYPRDYGLFQSVAVTDLETMCTVLPIAAAVRLSQKVLFVFHERKRTYHASASHRVSQLKRTLCSTIRMWIITPTHSAVES